MSPSPTASGAERGAGMVATMTTVPVVLVLLLFASQSMLRLHTRSTVTALASHAAREAALDTGRPGHAIHRAGHQLRQELGPAGDEAVISWSIERERIEIRVRIPAPRLLALQPFVGTETIDVAASSHRETWR